MQPKFKNLLEYEKAQLLLQPIYIRLIDNIRQKSESLAWNVTYEEISKPIPGYKVCIEKDNQVNTYDFWELCYKICFDNYKQAQIESVTTDPNLIDPRGEVDWQQIEIKTKELVQNLFV